MNEGPVRYTPGLGGYFLAGFVAAVVLDLEMVGLGVLIDGGGDVGETVALFMMTVIVAFPIGSVGYLMVHLACSRVRWQIVHVVAAFGSAYAITLLIGLFMALVSAGQLSTTDLPAWLLTVLPVAVAAAVGRAAVVPLVPPR